MYMNPSKVQKVVREQYLVNVSSLYRKNGKENSNS